MARVPEREKVMREALSDARRTVSTYQSGQDGTSAEAIADVGRTVASDEVTHALASSENVENGSNQDEQPAEKVPRRTKTSTVADIRRELARPPDENG